MLRMIDLLPNVEDLLRLEPEELAGFVMEQLNSWPETDRRNHLHPGNYPNNMACEYASDYREKVALAIMEAWGWLEREGLIATRPTAHGGWAFVTRRGEKLKNRIDLAKLRQASLLPHKVLHPKVAAAVWHDFLVGNYDSAVFKAFKEVEIAVRGAAGLAPSDLGVDLMRKAFHETTGALTDKTELVPERQALSHLFAGAIGRFKNPGSHRQVGLQDGAAAAEMVMLASLLLRITDERHQSGP